VVRQRNDERRNIAERTLATGDGIGKAGAGIKAAHPMAQYDASVGNRRARSKRIALRDHGGNQVALVVAGGDMDGAMRRGQGSLPVQKVD
jgi:hypothetical protein